MTKLLKAIKIEKIGYGGIGLARMADGKRILIKGGALPGSVVDLRIVKQRKDFLEAHITHIHKHDPELVDGKPFCPHFFRMEKEASPIEDGGIENGEGKNSNSELGTIYPKLKWKIGCGGCKWQMLSYPTQLKLKQDIVLDAFKKLAKEQIEVLPIVGSPLEKGYRNKIEFSFGKYITNSAECRVQSAEKKTLDILSDRSVGFHKQGEFSKIVDIDSCGLISEKANSIFFRIKELCLDSGLPVYDQMTHQGFFRHLVIREGFHTDQILVNLSVSDDNLKQSKTDKWDALLELFKKNEFLKKSVTTFVITYNNGLGDTIKNDKSETKTFWGEGYIYEKLIFEEIRRLDGDVETNISSDEKNHLSKSPKNLPISSKISQSPHNHQIPSEVSFRVSPFSFFQTNTLGAEQLFSLAMYMTGHVEGTILDLYCGTGSIGLSFLKANKGNTLIGIEIVPEAIMDAQHNAKINGLENQVLFVADPAEKALTNNPELRAQIKDIGLVIVDPPRDGLHKNVVAFLGELKKEQDFKLLYISCNPITMMRDIELLLTHGFHIKQIQPVDMFPQTHHIEVIGVLT